jgi:hypothetical protein
VGAVVGGGHVISRSVPGVPENVHGGVRAVF